MLPTPQLKIAIKEKIKNHKRAIAYIPWSTQKKEIEVKIKAFQEVLEMMEGPDGYKNTQNRQY